MKIIASFIIAVIIIFSATGSFAEPPEHIVDATSKLVQYCSDPRGSVDERAVASLAEFVMASKPGKESALPKQMDSTGAYYEFDMKIPFSRFIEYSYNPYIPPVITRPSSLRYSTWSGPKAEIQRLPANWKPVPPGGAPVVIHGMQHESDTPDLNTGVYHEYDLKRTLIVFNYKGRQAMVSISKQLGRSNVGKKGFILGSDSNWNYYYTGEPGTPKAGLGWIKSYIYDYFSIGVFVETGSAPLMVRTGVFQWLRAGWSGINFVKPNHILAGMRRFSRDCRASLESPHLPAPNQITSVYQWLSNMPSEDLKARYTALQHGHRSLAVQSGHISKADDEEQVSFANTPKEQMLQEIMLEYLKVSLGKPTVLGKQSFLAAPPPIRESRETSLAQ